MTNQKGKIQFPGFRFDQINSKYKKVTEIIGFLPF